MMMLSCNVLLVDRQALSEHTPTSSSTTSLGQALSVSLVKPGAYLSESYAASTIAFFILGQKTEYQCEDGSRGSVARTTGNLIQESSGPQPQSTGDRACTSPHSSHGFTILGRSSVCGVRWYLRYALSDREVEAEFGSFRTALRIIQGYEAMPMIQKGQIA